MHCPDCNSDRCIPWDDGYICCSCGCEFDDPDRKHKHEDKDENEEWRSE